MHTPTGLKLKVEVWGRIFHSGLYVLVEPSTAKVVAVVHDKYGRERQRLTVPDFEQHTLTRFGLEGQQ